MLLIVRSQANVEERTELINFLDDTTGGKYSVPTGKIEGKEAIVLDGNIIDETTQAELDRLYAVERIIPVNTEYKLVSKVVKNETSKIMVGTAHECQPVVIGETFSPVIIAGPCAVENREQISLPHMR